MDRRYTCTDTCADKRRHVGRGAFACSHMGRQALSGDAAAALLLHCGAYAGLLHRLPAVCAALTRSETSDAMRNLGREVGGGGGREDGTGQVLFRCGKRTHTRCFRCKRSSHALTGSTLAHGACAHISSPVFPLHSYVLNTPIRHAVGWRARVYCERWAAQTAQPLSICLGRFRRLRRPIALIGNVHESALTDGP